MSSILMFHDISVSNGMTSTYCTTVPGVPKEELCNKSKEYPSTRVGEISMTARA